MTPIPRRWSNPEVHAYTQDRKAKTQAWRKAQREFFRSKRKAEQKAWLLQIVKALGLVAAAFVGLVSTISCPAAGQ